MHKYADGSDSHGRGHRKHRYVIGMHFQDPVSKQCHCRAGSEATNRAAWRSNRG